MLSMAFMFQMRSLRWHTVSILSCTYCASSNGLTFDPWKMWRFLYSVSASLGHFPMFCVDRYAITAIFNGLFARNIHSKKMRFIFQFCTILTKNIHDELFVSFFKHRPLVESNKELCCRLSCVLSLPSCYCQSNGLCISE